MSDHGSPTTRRFVRTAWILLLCQLFAAAGAVAAAVWAVSAVRSLVNDRAMLQARVAELEAAQNQVTPAPAPPPSEPVNSVVEEPAQPQEMPTPVPAPTPAPAPAPRQPQVRPQPHQPQVVQPDIPVYEPPVYTPPPYTPPRTDEKPPEVDQPPDAPPQRRPRPRINVPGIISDILNHRPTRTPRPSNTNPPRAPGGVLVNPNNPNNGRPPANNGANPPPPR